MRKIRWNKLAREDYYHTIDYLLEEWSEKEAQDYTPFEQRKYWLSENKLSQY
jgi:uncharacterized LabA/DUF88 family protein